MKDITTIDWSAPMQKCVEEDRAKQKVFFIQNGIQYDAGGNACNKAQVKDYYAKLAASAQAEADAAKEAAAAAQKNADALMKDAGVTKTALKQAAAEG